MHTARLEADAACPAGGCGQRPGRIARSLLRLACIAGATVGAAACQAQTTDLAATAGASVQDLLGDRAANTLVLSQSPAARGTAQAWRQSMLWHRRDRTGFGLGLDVLVPAQPQGPLASQRGADTTGLDGNAGAPPAPETGAALALLAVARPVASGVALHMAIGVPLTAGLRSSAGAGPLDQTADGLPGDSWRKGGRSEMRMGLSFGSNQPYAGLRRGLAMRMVISGATTLSVRPRGGGRVLVQLHSQW
jgi:hypothetical protein